VIVEGRQERALKLNFNPRWLWAALVVWRAVARLDKEPRSITCATGQRSGDRICLGLPRVPHATNLAESFYENLFLPGDIHD
jgi:hypothetical protein